MLRFRLKMLNRKHYGHVFVRETYAKKLTVRKYLKMIRMPLTFVYLALKGCFLAHGLLLVNWYGQIYQSQQNAKEIKL